MVTVFWYNIKSKKSCEVTLDMATGIPSSSVSEKTILASLKSKQPYSLPKGNAVTIHYPNKNLEAKILLPITNNFVKIENNHFFPIKFFQENDLIFSDNIFALHQLINQRANFDLIYLDPPYNTGYDFNSKSNGHSYSDNFDLSEYIEFMRIRLILLRELLSDKGSIYIHIGHQMLHYIKVIMDEVFGTKNFRNLIVRKKCSSKNYTKNQYPNLNDYILFYSKGNDFIWNPQGTKPTEEWIKKEYPKVDEKGQFKLVPIHAPGERNGETGKKWRGMLPPKGKHWQYTPSKLDELDKNGEIHWSKTGNPRRKVYLTDDKLIPLTDYWENFRDAYHQSIKTTGYPTEKNLSMLEAIVRSSSDSDSLILDPFCGSGTTLNAALNEGRKCIGIDQSLSAIEHTLQRLNNKLRLIVDEDVFNLFSLEILSILR